MVDEEYENYLDWVYERETQCLEDEAWVRMNQEHQKGIKWQPLQNKDFINGLKPPSHGTFTESKTPQDQALLTSGPVTKGVRYGSKPRPLPQQTSKSEKPSTPG